MATTSSSGPRRPRARAPGQGSPGSAALVARDLRRGAHGCRGRCDLRRCLPPCEPRAHQSAQRVSATALGYTGGHDRTWHRQAPPGHLLPGLAPRAPSSLGGSPHQRDRHLLACSGSRHAGSRSWLRPLGSRSCRSPRSRRWPTAWTPRSEPFATVPWTAAPTRSCWADALVVKVREAGRTVNVHVLVVTGVNALGPPRDPRRRGRHQRGCGRLARLLALACGTRALGGGARDLRCPPGARRGDRGDPTRGHLAAVSYPLSAGSLGQGGQVPAAVGGNPGAHHLRPAGRHRGHSSVPTGHRGAGREAARGC